jgi:hypothetical protein
MDELAIGSRDKHSCTQAYNAQHLKDPRGFEKQQEEELKIQKN